MGNPPAVIVAGAVCETGCEDLLWLLVIGGIILFILWLLNAAAFGWAAGLAVRRLRPALPMVAVIVIGGVATIVVAALSATMALSDVGLLVLGLPVFGVGWLCYELWAARRTVG